MKAIGYKIKEARQRAGYTQSELAESLEVTQPAISRIENGDYVDLKVGNLMKLQQVLDQPIEYFLGLDGDLTMLEAELLEIHRSLESEGEKVMLVEMARSIKERVGKLRNGG